MLRPVIIPPYLYNYFLSSFSQSWRGQWNFPIIANASNDNKIQRNGIVFSEEKNGIECTLLTTHPTKKNLLQNVCQHDKSFFFCKISALLANLIAIAKKNCTKLRYWGSRYTTGRMIYNTKSQFFIFIICVK